MRAGLWFSGERRRESENREKHVKLSGLVMDRMWTVRVKEETHGSPESGL